MRDLLFPSWTLLQPLIESLTDDETPLAPLHLRPQPAVFDQRVIATVDRSHDRAVVGGFLLSPEWNKAPSHALELVFLGLLFRLCLLVLVFFRDWLALVG